MITLAFSLHASLKPRRIHNRFAAVVAVCTLFICTKPSLGDNPISGSSLNITGSGTIGALTSNTAAINTLSSETAIFNLLQVAGTGTVDIASNSLFFGTSGTTAALNFSYQDGINPGFTLLSTAPKAAWIWKRLVSGSTTISMQLDSSNRLILTSTDAGNSQIVLDPNGSNAPNVVLTQAVGDNRYLPATAGLNLLNGKVGVGTSNPSAQLDVYGSLNVGTSSTTTLFVNGTTGNVSIGTNNPQVINSGTANPPNGYALTVRTTGTTSGALHLWASSTEPESVPIFAVGDQQDPKKNWIDSYGLVRFRYGLIIGTSDFNDPIYPGWTTGFNVICRYNGCAAQFQTDYAADDRAMIRFKSRTSDYMYSGAQIHNGTTQYAFYNACGTVEPPLLVINNGNALTGTSATRGGQVGINTSDPAAQLHIKTVSPTYVTQINQAAPSQTANLTEWQNSSGNVLSAVNAAGSIGIGTATPQAKLDVKGGVNVSGTLAISGSGALVVSGTRDSNGTIVAGETNPLILIPQQGDLSMGDFKAGAQPPTP